MEIICELCGDKGFEKAFVFCGKCLDFAIHRYCLPEIPNTLGEIVRWFCVDCGSRYRKRTRFNEHCSCQSAKADPIASSDVYPRHSNSPVNGNEEKRHQNEPTWQPRQLLNELANSDQIGIDNLCSMKKFNKSKMGVDPVINWKLEAEKISTSPVKETDEKRHGNGCNDQPSHYSGVSESDQRGEDFSLLRKDSKRSKLGLQPEINFMVTAEKISTDPAEAIDKKRHTNTPIELSPGLRSIVAGCDQKDEDSFSWRKKSKRSKNSKKRKKKMMMTNFVRPMDIVTELEEQKFRDRPCREPCVENNETLTSESGKICKVAGTVRNSDTRIVCAEASSDLERIPAQPLIDPIWSGSFSIDTEDYGLDDGVVAHLSSKACEKACREATLFPKSLRFELLPRAAVWPKSFQSSQKCEDHIALYFFALNKSFKSKFVLLVNEMMGKDLALRTLVTNAELLVFTSNELPLEYWKFEGDFYLWGVFRGKQASSGPTNRQLVIQSSEKGRDRSIANIKASDAMSPISPLSNNSSYG